ncbi:adenylate/guanylate cyclase domain-containing protein [Rhizobiales bacterium]|uniref:adenylate/guanylate cyclase domain-containing protein n=1 Tax=Hongsoonwoonella zoysiae TaxID=2821844 RepID=UPI00155FC0EC|nr:adenylate/guanylate cyclase domain-containing protein [Hongsoonwoonella zoysiae]NRG17621.1 adenylate/guanylate cyclase domain-containing protein [Hongsoonwoonella zoysiae]
MAEDSRRKLAAIVVADVAGYSRLMGEDDAGTLASLRAHRAELVDPLVAAHGGRTVKTMGDGLLMEFPSVVDAVNCALAIQHGMAERNSNLASPNAIRFRIGIHLGDVIVEGDDIFGDGVNIASRIEALAVAGGIALSDDAYRQVRDRSDVAWADGGEHALKNIARPVTIWRWSVGEDRTPSPGPKKPAAEKPPPDRASIAVLPFDNMSGDPEQAYFADGITEDIITELSKVSGLTVIARNSTFVYKAKAARIQDVAADLGVAHVVEGSVRKAGSKVRITAQLIDGATGGHLWAERYDRELADIFAVQDDVTGKIVEALSKSLIAPGPTPAPRHEPAVPEAYDCVLRGREQYRLFTPEGNRAADGLYSRAIALDPAYAAGYAGLAMVRMHDWFAGEPDALDKAYELAQKASELDPALPLVHEALGNIRLFRREYEEATASIERWIELEPGSADAYANLAGLLHFTGEPEKVAPLIDKATGLNPFFPFYYTLYCGQAYLMMGRYDEALEALRRAATRNEDALPAQLYLAACHGLRGEDKPAQDALARVFRLHPGFSVKWLKTYFPYRREEDTARLLAGLEVAGFSA